MPLALQLFCVYISSKVAKISLRTGPSFKMRQGKRGQTTVYSREFSDRNTMKIVVCPLLRYFDACHLLRDYAVGAKTLTFNVTTPGSLRC